MVPRENKNIAYAKFGGTNKEYYGIFRNGQFMPPCSKATCAIEAFRFKAKMVSKINTKRNLGL